MPNPALYFSDAFAQSDLTSLWQQIDAYYLCSEETLIQALLPLLDEPPTVLQQAKDWVETIRSEPQPGLAIATLMQQFNLASKEGLALMTLAEALLRIPDEAGALALLQDKLALLDLQHLHQQHDLKQSHIWAIALAQQLVTDTDSPSGLLGQLWRKMEHKTLLAAVRKAMHLLGDQFVFAENIEDALQQQYDLTAPLTRYSFDMLGEAAICKADVDQYFTAYLNAIIATGRNDNKAQCSISIKLSALCARYENFQQEKAIRQIGDRMLQLLLQARNLDVAITLDAEEAHRLELSLQIFSELLQTDICQGWGGLGLAVQAYSKRALPTLGWLEQLAKHTKTPIPVRLVKGAYWDTEIKLAQQQGLTDYPVFTDKAATDLNYQVCARFLLSEQCQFLQPQFASHNAYTLSALCHIPTTKTFELQRLHGMGEQLHQQLNQQFAIPTRIYAPIGSYSTLLPYLVRRLMENGASASFVFQLHQPANASIELLTPIRQQLQSNQQPIPLPQDVFQPLRDNSPGLNSGSLSTLSSHYRALSQPMPLYECHPMVGGAIHEGNDLLSVYSPHDQQRLLGYRNLCTEQQIGEALACAEHFLPTWRQYSLTQRSQVLENYATLLASNAATLIPLCMAEAGKTLSDAIDELREAIDFCYYYAKLAHAQLSPLQLAAVTGEENTLRYQGKGIFLCISPWNFPLAIFTGQIAAALVTGNCVLTKPASATSLLAAQAVKLWIEAGVPPEALQFIPYRGGEHTQRLLQDSRLSGVAFTGSTAVAATLNQQLGQRSTAPIASLIAETGGINAMLVDSSALPEQVIRDVLRSAFNSAGQRCSALRVLYLQRDIADALENRLTGAMQELCIGDPMLSSTDIGPVIDTRAQMKIFEHIERQRLAGRLLFEMTLPEATDSGCFVPPTLIRLHSLDELTEEVFGPVLHIIRYDQDQLDRVLAEISRSGFGLTLGIHSRNDNIIDTICNAVDVGNIYINRDQVGAVVAAQPFGGMGLSGTGPKAGGPNYLKAFCREQTICRNTTAEGGDRELLS
ncbi:bifunctional proline dehydrogenase/L-glutamate gamma-semialdehyde dehydrogenase PutA [Pontibacter sp. JAM-7]|uniref:bifunctional proline dehydrogenase/L-glutamate gamma-semialdehyde dehydrogenase PutA n=1 Tax=Pontibacter sp. JAM-7 TaxID=3366581 RepID=UPI003AF5D831